MYQLHWISLWLCFKKHKRRNDKHLVQWEKTLVGRFVGGEQYLGTSSLRKGPPLSVLNFSIHLNTDFFLSHYATFWIWFEWVPQKLMFWKLGPQWWCWEVTSPQKVGPKQRQLCCEGDLRRDECSLSGTSVILIQRWVMTEPDLLWLPLSPSLPLEYIPTMMSSAMFWCSRRAFTGFQTMLEPCAASPEFQIKATSPLHFILNLRCFITASNRLAHTHIYLRSDSQGAYTRCRNCLES